jgi:phosphohistidine phosphatase SixA
MLRILLAALATAAAAAALLAGQDPEAAPPAPVTVFLLRHAETAADTRTDRDPALSDAGVRRSEAVARLLGEVGVTRLYCSEFRRTRDTLAPLAEKTGLEVKTIGAADASSLLDELRGLPPGAVAVVAGHSNTVPSLVEALSGAPVSGLERGAIAHDQHDRLFLVVLPTAGAAARRLELAVGAPPPQAGRPSR